MPLSERFFGALDYAARLHAAQTRKGSGVPYVAHLLAVAALVIESGGDEDESIAALLHDAVEDQGGTATAAEIRRRFGDRVAEIVEGCSDTDVIPKPPWRPRKEAHLAHLRVASPSVLLVCAADKLHNARSILDEYRRQGDALWVRFKGGRDGTLWYYGASLAVLKERSANGLVEELERVVAELQAVAGGAGP